MTLFGLRIQTAVLNEFGTSEVGEELLGNKEVFSRYGMKKLNS